MKKSTFTLLFTLITLFSFAQDGTNDPTFNTFDDGTYGDGAGFNHYVYSTSIQPDGKIIVGGQFTTFNGTARNYIARLNADGSLDASFDPQAGFNNIVYSTSIQPDGKIIVGGDFTSFNGTARRIVRLNEDGSLDASFNPGTGFNSIVFSTSIQPDGKIIVGGDFTTFNGTARNRIARLNADGSLDTDFNPGTGFNGWVYSTSIQSDGKIIVGGNFGSFNGTARNYIARLNTDGSLDASFDPGTGFNNGVLNRVYSTSIQPDGKIIVGGNFSSFNGTARNYIARLNTDGSLDASFNPQAGFNDIVFSTSIQSDGKIIVGGDFTTFNGTARRIARLNPNGSLDASFNPGTGFNAVVHSTSIQPDGKIIVGGQFTIFNGTTRNRIARLNPDGSLDASFNPGTGFNSVVHSTSIQPDGKIIVGGQFTTFNGTARNRIARLNTDGSLDASFNPQAGFNDIVFSTSIQPDGKIIVGGDFASFNGTPRNRIARLNPDGSLDASFNSGIGFNSVVHSTSIQPDGKIIVGGQFTTFNGTARNRIVRLNADGSLDASFNLGTGFNNIVHSTSIQPDGKIIVGGNFSSFNGTARNRIARLNSDGSLDASFNPGTGFNNIVHSTSIQPDGKIIVGGAFTSFNGTARNRIARLNPDGSLDASFDPGTGFNNIVYSTSIQPDGKIIVGGQFTTFNGTARNYIARLNADGSLDASFDPQAGFNNIVRSTSIQPDGKIIVGGNFTTFNGTPRNRIARLLNCASPATGTAVISHCGPYTWIDGIEYTASNNTATFTISGGAANGCDSIVTLNLTINTGTYNSETQTACESYTWNGTTYTTSGMKLYSYTNGSGCPSTDTLHLTINTGTYNSETQTACESYTWNGTTYTTSGMKLYSYTNGSGCPSTDTLHLTINTGTYNSETQTACESYTWNGTTYTTSGMKLYSYTNGSGCPSTDTLHLTINTGTYNSETQTACESYTWNGTTYTTSGMKLYSYTNGSGCPSTDTLHLTINTGTYNSETQTACESYTWNGTTYTTSGMKLYDYTNGSGCPSTDTLHLTINTIDATVSENGITLTANLSGANYQWIDCDNSNAPIAGETAQTFTALANGNYAVIVDNGTCSDTSDCIVVNSVGIASLTQNEWKLYPNPTSGMFTVSANQLLDNALVEIHSTDGRLIYSTVFSGTEMSFNIGNNPPGVYILRVDNKDTFRVIKN